MALFRRHGLGFVSQTNDLGQTSIGEPRPLEMKGRRDVSTSMNSDADVTLDKFSAYRMVTNSKSSAFHCRW